MIALHVRRVGPGDTWSAYFCSRDLHVLPFRWYTTDDCWLVGIASSNLNNGLVSFLATKVMLTETWGWNASRSFDSVFRIAKLLLPRNVVGMHGVVLYATFDCCSVGLITLYISMLFVPNRAFAIRSRQLSVLREFYP